MDFTATLQTLEILNALEVLERIVRAAEENEDAGTLELALAKLEYIKRGLTAASLQNGVN